MKFTNKYWIYTMKTHRSICTLNPDNVDNNATLVKIQVTQLFHRLQQQTPPMLNNSENHTDDDNSSTANSETANNNNNNTIPETNPNPPESIYTTGDTAAPPDGEHTSTTVITITTTVTTVDNNDDGAAPIHNRKLRRDKQKLTQKHTPDNCINPNGHSCVADNVINLSGIPLSRVQTTVLSKGLSFVHTADNAKPTEIVRDFNIFANKTHKNLAK